MIYEEGELKEKATCKDFLQVQIEGNRQIKRKEKEIYKVLIIEIKIKGFENDTVFLKKKNFVSNEFLKQSNNKFGYKRFDFLYHADSDKMAVNI